MSVNIIFKNHYMLIAEYINFEISKRSLPFKF